MGLAKDISGSRKINAHLSFKLLQMDESGQAEDTPCLSLIFQTKAAMPTNGRDLLDGAGQPVEGVKLNSKIETIFTAHASLRGLKNLIDDERVRRIEGSQRLSPN